MLKVVNELVDAVQNAMHIGNQTIDHHHHHPMTNGRPFVLERKQALRRVDRAVRTFEKEFHRVQKVHQARRNINDDEKSVYDLDESLTLDDESLSAMVDILITLPSLYGTKQKHNQESELNRMIESNIGIIDDMLEQLVPSASKMILNHAHMPLHVDMVDRLLDRVAVLAVRGVIADDLISILNKSIVATWMDSMEDGLNEETQDSSLYDDGHRSVPPIAKPPLFLLRAEETISLTLLLTPITLEHLSNHYSFPKNGSSEKEDILLRQQSSEIGLRLLLLHIFRHLVDLLPEGTDDSKKDRMGALKNAYEVWFRDQMDSEKRKDWKYDMEHGFEDYMDMLTSFFVQNIEYASDVLTLSNEIITDGSEDDDNHGNYVALQIKEVTRLCSFAISVVDTFHGGLGLYTSLSRAQLDSLLVQFATYVANYCYSNFLPNYHDVIVAADEVLLRLYLLVADTCGEPCSKKVRIDSSARILQKSHVQMISFLRATHLYTSQCHENERKVVSMELERIQGMIQAYNSNHKNIHPKDIVESHAATTILQARAAASVIMGDHEDPQYQMRNSDLLSSLVTPITEHSQQEGDKVDSDSAMMGNFDPWNFLLARKVNESYARFNDDSQERRHYSLNPPLTILTNSTTSISDMKSQMTSFREEKCETLCQSSITHFLQSVPMHIHTLHQY